MRARWSVAVGVAAVLAGCGSASPALLRASPTGYLLGIDQLVSPDFTRDSGPHLLTAAGASAVAGTPVGALSAAGLTDAASEDFFRNTPVLAVLNGPVQITDSVEQFRTTTGASSTISGDISRGDARRGATAVSTGSLGDAAHATMRTATAPDGTAVTEITVEWRLANVLNVLVVRGRDGAVRLDDALLLAHRQTVAELGLATATAAP